MNRGSRADPMPCPRPPSRFNEAPIHESGKLSGHGPELAGVRASMRPRFMNRGSAVECIASDVGGRRFNEAPIHESGKFRPRAPAGPNRPSLQ